MSGKTLGGLGEAACYKEGLLVAMMTDVRWQVRLS
jgi:hypothetical protein